MYTLTVNNNYGQAISSASGGIPAGASHSFEKLGSIILEVPGMGAFNFIDLGEKKIEGYPEVKETWGVLVRSTTTEAYYRYEGGGDLTLAFDLYGTGTLSAKNGTLIPIGLEELIVVTSGLPNN